MAHFERGEVLWMFFSPVLLEDGRRRGRSDSGGFSRAFPKFFEGSPRMFFFFFFFQGFARVPDHFNGLVSKLIE